MLEIIKASIMAGLPIAVFSFALVYWAIKKEYISKEDNIQQLKDNKKQSKKDKVDFNVNPIHKKWLYFGGGYYGLMAFITYIHIEWLEIKTFVLSYTSFSNLVDQVTVSAFVGLIIDSFLNLIPAFLWFSHWPDFIDIQNGWYWLLTSYAGYHVGEYLAKWMFKNNANI
jgi:hypothetical protein